MGLRKPRASGDGNPPAVVPPPPAPVPLCPEEPCTTATPVASLPASPPATASPGVDSLPSSQSPVAQPAPTALASASSAETVAGDAWGKSAASLPTTARPAPYQVSHGGTRLKEVVADRPCLAKDLASSVCSSQYYSWQLRERSDVYFSPQHILQPGDVLRFTHIAGSEGISLPLTFLLPPPSQVATFLQPSISCLERARLLHLQNGRLADDQMHYLLRDLATVSPNPLLILHPLELLSAYQHQDHSRLQCRLQEIRSLADFGIVGAAPLAGHWVSFAWICDGATVAAWNSYAPRHSDDGISVINCLLGRALQRALSQFRFLDGPVRPLNGPHCGRFALADLRSLLQSSPYLPDQEVLAMIRREAAGQLPAAVDGLVPLPVCIASGQELLEGGLAATLKAKGVPESQVRARASAAIAAIGAGKVQQAMHSKAPWRELKAVANQASPAFQLVLPFELDLVVKAKSVDGRPIPAKRKQKQAPPFAVHTSHKRHSLLPALDMVQVPSGVFTSAVGDLDHIEPGAVGPHAKGVFLLDHEAALPYTQVSKPVSSSALGLLVLGHTAVDGAVLPGASLRFTAKLRTSAVAFCASLPVGCH